MLPHTMRTALIRQDPVEWDFRHDDSGTVRVFFDDFHEEAAGRLN